MSINGPKSYQLFIDSNCGPCVIIWAGVSEKSQVLSNIVLATQLVAGAPAQLSGLNLPFPGL